MKRLLAVAAGIAVAIAILAPSARADDALQTQLTAAYMNQCTLIQKSDYDGFAKTMTPDYVAIEASGKQVSLADTMAVMKDALAQIEISACHVTFVDPPVQTGQDAVATVVLSQDGTVQGSAPLGVVSRERDTFTSKDGTWLLKRSEILEQTVTIAGRVVQHEGAPPAASPSPSPSPSG